jgi:hypothetical protein
MEVSDKLTRIQSVYRPVNTERANVSINRNELNTYIPNQDLKERDVRRKFYRMD